MLFKSKNIMQEHYGNIIDIFILIFGISVYYQHKNYKMSKYKIWLLTFAPKVSLPYFEIFQIALPFFYCYYYYSQCHVEYAHKW